MRRRVVAACVVLGAMLPTPALAQSYRASVHFTAETEGSYPLRSGDWIAGGLIFFLPGSHPATRLTVEGFVDYPLFCDPELTRQVANSAVPMFRVTADVPQDDERVIPTAVAADPAAFQRAFEWRPFPGCEVAYSGPVANFHVTVESDQPTPVRVALHYRNPAGKGYANINCADPASNPYPANPAPCDARFTPFHTLTPSDVPTTPVPPGAVGGLLLALIVGVGLVGVQFMHRRTTTRVTTPS